MSEKAKQAGPNWPAIEKALFADPRGLAGTTMVTRDGMRCAGATLDHALGILPGSVRTHHEAFDVVAAAVSSGEHDRLYRERLGFGTQKGEMWHLSNLNDDEPNPKLRPIRALNGLRKHFDLPALPDDYRPKEAS